MRDLDWGFSESHNEECYAVEDERFLGRKALASNLVARFRLLPQR